MTLRTITSILALSSAISGAATIGIETFDTDGAINNQNGGTHWDWNNLTQMHTATTSDWDSTSGSPAVSGGILTTNNSSAKREFNGPDEGSGTGDGDTTERSGGFRGSGAVYFASDMTRSASASWSGMSSYDFGAERIFFGVHGGGAATDTIGIQDSISGTNVTGSISLTDGVSYRIAAVVDFDNDLLGLWVDPDGADSWDGTGGTADVTMAFTRTNWSTAVRLGSGGSATWDNLIVATSLSEVAIPEPSSSSLLALCGMSLIIRRRR
ncbi:hypothetical protein HW115_07115 [Verrucomicrobiaceae bacterium N1E253]|uniref:PEP-CTERM protein-sorting domain-containing protein n=1 Tax=Oceaniferula marina TaxID=2748318 RepID=A0A851GJN2_9BACT|nr:hypothetical protein [Oceaniferula marina]NWK55375.1 hypothetical protein [Oceaniferula marina]